MNRPEVLTANMTRDGKVWDNSNTLTFTNMETFAGVLENHVPLRIIRPFHRGVLTDLNGLDLRSLRAAIVKYPRKKEACHCNLRKTT